MQHTVCLLQSHFNRYLCNADTMKSYLVKVYADMRMTDHLTEAFQFRGHCPELKPNFYMH